MQSSVPSWFGPSTRRHALFLRILLFGAPFALALSFYLHDSPSHHAQFLIPIDRAKVIAAAYRTAARLGLDARGWTPQVRAVFNSDMIEYFRRRPVPQSTPARRFAGELGAGVMLAAPDGSSYLDVTFAADGAELGYRISGKNLQPVTPLPEDIMLGLAAIEMKPVVNELSMEGLGTPEISVNESAGVAGVRRVTFRPFAPKAPDLQFTVNLDFLGGRIIAREIRAEASEMFVGRVLRGSRSLAAFGNVFRLVLILSFSIYAAYRFSRRIADREAAVLRAIVLAAVVPLCGSVMYFMDPALSARELKPEDFTVAGLAAGLLARLFSYFIQAIAMGMSYGGGEGYIREAFPGKLVSLDAILKGRILSANTGQAVITGTAIGCWLVLGYHLLLPFTGNPLTVSILTNTAIALSRFPWFIYFLKSVLVALFAGSICLLVPILIYRRLTEKRALLFCALLVTALLIGAVDESYTPDSPDFWLRSLIMAVCLVGSFFVWDFLSAIVALTSLLLLAPLADMLDRMPAWHQVLPLAGALGFCTTLPMLIAAFRGRMYTEKDLLPKYALVQAERLSLQAELSAAREAQLRLLPASLPDLPGISLAASCTPAHEVAGDFYDFIELGDGTLCIIVAEGGNEGLASALTIALAKGFLMFEAAACRDVHRTLADLERILGENLQRTSGRTAIALLLVNPADRHVSIARAGSFPRILALRAGAAPREAILLEDASDGIARGSLTLDSGDSILIFTDGLARLARQRQQGEVEEILRRAAGSSVASSAAAIHEVILSSLLPRDRKPPADLADDITAVVVSFSSAAVRGQEEVA